MPNPPKNISPKAVVEARRDLIFHLIVEKKASKEDIRQALADAGFKVNPEMLKKDITHVNELIKSLTPAESKEETLTKAVDDLTRLAILAEKSGNYKAAADIVVSKLKVTGAWQPASKIKEQNITYNTQINNNNGLTKADIDAMPIELKKALLAAQKNKTTILLDK